MHTEHLQNVRPVRVIAGWLIAIAVTSMAAMAAIGLGLLLSDEQTLGTVATLFAVIVGFWVGGFFAGFRALEAPILHGIGIGLTSIVAWAGLNAVISVFSRSAGWEGLTPGLTVAVLLAQIVSAVVGGLMGYNVALRGRPSLAEHEPLERELES